MNYVGTLFVGTTPDMSIFEVMPISRVKGVNLGSWFIPVPSVTPSFFEGFPAISLCQMAIHDREVSNWRMLNHLNQWITEEDFAQIRSFGLSAVRVPIGYWNVSVPKFVLVHSIE